MKGSNTKTSHDSFDLKKEYDFSRAMRGRFYRPSKKTTTIRLDDDVILYFKKKAGEKKVGVSDASLMQP